MRNSALASVALVLSIAFVGTASAQPGAAPSTLDMVRIHFDPPGTTRARPPLSGRLHDITADSLTLRIGNEDGGDLRAIATSSIVRLDKGVRRGHLRGAGRGALIGSLVLAPVLGLAGALLLEGGDEGITPGEWGATGASLGVMIGAPVGAMWGAAKPGYRWVPASMPEPAP